MHALPLIAAAATLAAFVPPAWLWRSRSADPLHRLVNILLAAAATALPLLVVPLAFTSLHLEAAPVVALIAAVFKVLRQPAEVAASPPSHARVLLLAVVVSADLWAWSGHLYIAQPEQLRFPLSGGDFTVIQGGANFSTNPFHSLGGERYALDIVMLNRAGNRASSLAPRRLRDYASFGVPVTSPCAGRVEQARDALPDNPPGRRNTDHPRGNYVGVQCGNLYVELAHLKEGSVSVKPGVTIVAGTRVGAVGNSGDSVEPHLHIAVRRLQVDGNRVVEMPVPLSFDGETLTLNRRISR